MINLRSQTTALDDFTIAKHLPEFEGYGTDGVRFVIGPDGGMYEAKKAKADMSKDIADLTSWGVYKTPQLRLEPIADLSALAAVVPADYARCKVTSNEKEYIFHLGGTYDSARGDVKDAGNTGIWVPTSSDATQPVDFDFQLGNIVHAIPDSTKSLYEVNGQTVTDVKLAAYLLANPITGFTVTGDSIQFPDWKGRYLGASGSRGVGVTAGDVLSSTNKRHRHSVRVGDNANGTRKAQIHYSEHDNGNKYRYTNYEGSTYARPETVGMPICIIGGRSIILLPDSTKVAKEVTVTFSGASVDGGKTTRTIFEEVGGYISVLDLPVGKVIDTVTNANVVDHRTGIISYQRAKDGGNFTVTIALKDKPAIGSIERFDFNPSEDDMQTLTIPTNAKSLTFYNRGFLDGAVHYGTFITTVLHPVFMDEETDSAVYISNEGMNGRDANGGYTTESMKALTYVKKTSDTTFDFRNINDGYEENDAWNERSYGVYAIIVEY